MPNYQAAFSQEVYKFYGLIACETKPPKAFSIESLNTAYENTFDFLRNKYPFVNWFYWWYYINCVDSLLGTKHTLDDLYMWNLSSDSSIMVQIVPIFQEYTAIKLAKTALTATDGNFLRAIYKVAYIKSQRNAVLTHKLLKNQYAHQFGEFAYWDAYQNNLLNFDIAYHNLCYNKIFKDELLHRYDSGIVYELIKDSRFRGHYKDALDYVIQDYLQI